MVNGEAKSRAMRSHEKWGRKVPLEKSFPQFFHMTSEHFENSF
jgi:hypothetical protein